MLGISQFDGESLQCCRLSNRPANQGNAKGGSRHKEAHGPPRCFCRVLLCRSYRHREVSWIVRRVGLCVCFHCSCWPLLTPLSFWNLLQSPNGWHAAQALAAAYAPVLPSPRVAYRSSPSLQASVAVPQTEDTPLHSPKVKERLWRVVFHTRGSDVRQFSNLEELLEECSRWSWVQHTQQRRRRRQRPGAGDKGTVVVVHRARCASHTFTDVLSSIAGEQVGMCLPLGPVMLPFLHWRYRSMLT